MRRYPVVSVTCAALLGLLAAELYALLPVSTSVLLGALGLIGLSWGRFGHMLYAVVLAATLYGQFWHWNIPTDDVSHFAGRQVTLIGTVAALPEAQGRRVRLLVTARSVDAGAGARPVRGVVQINYYPREDSPRLHWGDSFSARVTLKPVGSLNNPGGYDYAAYQQRQGVRVRATAGARAGVTVLERAAPGVRKAIHGWRAAMRFTIEQALPPDPAALLTALAIGETAHLSQDLRQRFQAAGVAHVLAISGTHLGLVAGFVFLLVRWGVSRLPYRVLRPLTQHLTPRQIAGVAALLAVTGYALLSGGRTPTVRALIMVWMVMFALLSRRDAHAVTSLSVAALIVLALDPRALGMASFQLSFVAVLAILLALPEPPGRDPDDPPETARERLLRRVGGLARVTLAAGLATAPLVAWHFGQVSWPGFFANLLLVPLLGAVVLPVALVAAVLAPALGSLPLAGVVGMLLNGFLSLVSLFAALSGALALVAPPPLALVFFTYGAAFLAWRGRALLLPRAAVQGALLFVFAWFFTLHPPAPRGLLRVAFMDVSQGDSTVLIGPGGDALVVDGGPRFGRFDTGRLAVAPYLTGLGIHELRVLATHPQLDHEGGLTWLVERFHPPAVYTNGERRSGAVSHQRFVDAAVAGGTPPVALAAGDRPELLRGVGIEVLHPPRGAEGGGLESNDRSVVLRVTYGGHSFLLAGDVEAPAERMLAESAMPASTVLKVPHHGAATSSIAQWLDRVQPRVAVVSVGEDNRYGHPHPEVLARYAARGIVLYRTDRDGAVLFESDGVHLRTVTRRELALEPAGPGGAPGAERRNLLRLIAPGSLWRSPESMPPEAGVLQ